MDRLEIEAFPPAGPDKGWIACLAWLELCLAHLLHDGVLVIHPFPSIPRTGIRTTMLLNHEWHESHEY
jgi:hypothetical protein